MLEGDVQGDAAHLPVVWHCQSLSHSTLLHASSWDFAGLALAVRPEHVFRGNFAMLFCDTLGVLSLLCFFPVGRE